MVAGVQFAVAVLYRQVIKEADFIREKDELVGCTHVAVRMAGCLSTGQTQVRVKSVSCSCVPSILWERDGLVACGIDMAGCSSTGRTQVNQEHDSPAA
jgi:hypothetical protein